MLRTLAPSGTMAHDGFIGGDQTSPIATCPLADLTMFTIKNSYTGEILAQVKTLSDARNFCNQRLLKTDSDRVTFLSNLAAKYISVYDARCIENFIHCGF